MVDNVRSRQGPGTAQGVIVILTGFLPVLAIVAMFPAVGTMIAHFAETDSRASVKVPAMATAPGLGVAMSALVMGILVDIHGRRKMLLISTVLYAALGVVPFYLNDLNSIIASRLLLGISEAAILTAVNSLFADYWAERERRHWLTLQGIVGPALASLAIFFAGSLTTWSWKGSFLIYALALPLALAVWRFIDEPANSPNLDRNAYGACKATKDAKFPTGLIMRFAALSLLCSVIYYVFIVNGSLVWGEIGFYDPAAIGRISMLPSLFVLAGSGIFWFLGAIGAHYRIQVACFLSLQGTGLALMGLTNNWTGMIVAMALQQTGAGMTLPTLIAWGLNLLPSNHRGRGIGIMTAAFFLGQFCSPLIVSLVRNQVNSMQQAFLAIGVSALASAVAISFVRSNRPPRTTRLPTRKAA